MQADEPSTPPTEGPPPGRCAYHFQHRNHPPNQDYCGQNVAPNCRGGCRSRNGASARQTQFCFWHCACTYSDQAPGRVKQTSHNLRYRLEAAVRNREYLEGAFLGSDPQRPDVYFARLARADLGGDRLHLEGADLTNADLTHANLGGAHLESAKIPSAHLEDASLGSAHLEGAQLNMTHLERAWLGGAQLQGADLRFAYLEGTHLGRGLRGEAPHNGANLDRAELCGATLDYRSNCEGTNWGTPGEKMQHRWSDAAAVLRMIGRHYAETGNHERAHEFYVQEMRVHHRSVVRDPVGPKFWKAQPRLAFAFARRAWGRGGRSRRRAIKALWLSLVGHRFTSVGARIVWGFHLCFWRYGVSPGLVFFWMSILIFGCTVAFHFSGVYKDAPGVCSPSGWDAFALSLITFSTLGYGDWRPNTDWGHWVAGFEGVAGALLIAAFLVSLATKYVHRD